jgi:hypothetical protein
VKRIAIAIVLLFATTAALKGHSSRRLEQGKRAFPME